MHDEAIKRAHHTFTMPEKHRLTFTNQTVESVTMVELTIAEERAAAKLAPADMLLHELTKAAIKKVNGQPISSEDLAVLYNSFRPAQRDHATHWYRRLNVGSGEEAEQAFKNASISVE